MTITFLQAYNGDGIHIEHDGHHVIIDGGPKCEELESLVGEIVANHEIIDLLISPVNGRRANENFSKSQRI